MPGGQGYRARTRHTFARAFRAKGYIPLSVYLRTYRVGDHVDIKVNGAVHKVRLGSVRIGDVHLCEIGWCLTWAIVMVVLLGAWERMGVGAGED